MRTLHRNKRRIYYALKVGDEKVFDEYGNETGEVTPIYGDPVEFWCNVSSAGGYESVEAFGSFTAYSRTVCVSDISCPIAEDSVIWLGVTPDEQHNYIVVRRADSKNGILYALQEVTVS